MGLEEKVDINETNTFLSEITNKIKKIVTTQTIVYGLVSVFALSSYLSCAYTAPPGGEGIRDYRTTCDEKLFECNKRCIVEHRADQRAGRTPGEECFDFCESERKNCLD